MYCYNWSCFDVVMLKEQCNFSMACTIIARDFNLYKRIVRLDELKESIDESLFTIPKRQIEAVKLKTSIEIKKRRLQKECKKPSQNFYKAPSVSASHTSFSPSLR